MTDNYSKDQDNRDIDIVFVNTVSLNEEEMAEEDDDEDDDDEFDFNPNSLSTKQPRKRLVTMRLLPRGQEVMVRCRLPWTWTWLQARLRIRYPPTQRFGPVQQIIENQFSVLEYRLNNSTGQDGRSVINKFLTDICSNNTGTEKLNREEASSDSLQREKAEFDKYLSEQSLSDLTLGSSLAKEFIFHQLSIKHEEIFN